MTHLITKLIANLAAVFLRSGADEWIDNSIQSEWAEVSDGSTPAKNDQLISWFNLFSLDYVCFAPGEIVRACACVGVCVSRSDRKWVGVDSLVDNTHC